MKRAMSAWTVGVFVCATMAGAACERRPAEQESAQTPPAQTQPGAAGETEPAQRTDAGITTAVQARYYTDDMVRPRNIDVSTDNGVVTLSGTVDSEPAKQQAIKLAQSVEGVTRVNDQLHVAAEDQTASTTPTDQTPERQKQDETAPAATTGRTAGETVEPAWITTKIQSQYFINPEIKPWNIDVTTQSNGVVTLAGEVDSADDKAEAVRIARETEGVSRVEDRLRIKGEAAAGETAATTPAGDSKAGLEAPDAWLTSKIQAKYFMDDEVKGREIDVDTQDGMVTLSGAVGSEAERRQAVALARNTDGVKDVTDRLEVQPRLAESEAARSATEARPASEGVPPVRPVLDDTWITTKIQSKFFLDESVKGHQINVDTNKGVVTLKGSVDSEQQKKAADEIARGTDGVSKVINNLTVGQR